ncbi:hypothetical protein NDU88_001463 [Pleurodeles waltl]|uniref:Uncharacterized protein n=1 Tax=Pleurodeles waltl TaxID=8319 RepID=A0AAV7PCL7_PLEWA|nr:hypothetical protein NDU88_001463 [Pleurodeles waltl]
MPAQALRRRGLCGGTCHSSKSLFHSVQSRLPTNELVLQFWTPRCRGWHTGNGLRLPPLVTLESLYHTLSPDLAVLLGATGQVFFLTPNKDPSEQNIEYAPLYQAL